MGWNLWENRHLFTKPLVFTILYMSLASFNFGYDTNFFGSVMAMQSFTKEFGEWNEDLQLYFLAPYLSSLMNSLPFAGKLIGTLTTGSIMKRYGRKKAVLVIAVIGIIATILQCTATTAAQYTVGRVLNYLTTGIIISVVPTYQSETAPAELRGGIIATLQLWNGVGGVLGACLTYGLAENPGKISWVLPTALQAMVPVALLAGYKFIPESPRWLIWNDKREEALAALRFLRPKSTSTETLNYEIDLILEADLAQPEGNWNELFKHSNARRTMIAIGAMVGQQITGQAFVGQYQTVFLQQQKVTSPSPFILNVITSTTNLLVLACVSMVIDTFGRRPIVITGGTLMGIWLFVMGGLGIKSEEQELNQVQKNTLIATLAMYSKSFSLSWAPLAYVIMGEVPTNRLREKTVMLSASISVVCTFLTSFTAPYLLNAPYANLGARVGFIYGSLCIAAVVWAFFFLPELKNRSLEELDEMFDAKVPTFKFSKYECTGIGRQIHDIEARADGGVKVVE